MNSEANDNAGVQMLDSGVSGKAANSKKKYIIGGVVALLVVVGVILGVTLKKKSGDDGGSSDDGVNPMLAIYEASPDFSLYGKDGKGDLFTENLWNQPNYGGPVQKAIVRSQDEGGENIEIKNGLTEVLTKLNAEKGSLNGLYSLRNLQNLNVFYNIDIFADNIAS